MSDPGRLRTRLVVEAPQETPDGLGGVVVSYASVATLWAEVTPVSARADVEADRAGARVTHRIRIRHRTDLTTRHRLRTGDRSFRILALREADDLKRFLQIEVEEMRA